MGDMIAQVAATLSPWMSLAALACSALALWLIQRTSAPASTGRGIKQVQHMISAWEGERDLLHATRERWTQEFNGIAERCDETLDRAESKRRRYAAAESRERGQANGAPAGADPWEGMSRQQIIDAGRRMQRGG